MTFDAIINGATGILYWGAPYLAKEDTATWPALKKVAAEVKALEPALTGEWLAADHFLDLSNHNVEAAVRKSAGETVLILANASPSPAGQVQVRAGAKALTLEFGAWEVKVLRY